MKRFDLLLLGGGHTHVLVLKQLARKPLPHVRVTLVSQSSLTPYSGMLPGYVAGHYDELETRIDLNQLAIKTGARFIRATAVAIDTAHSRVVLDGRPALQYDALSIDIGSTPDLSVPGAGEFAIGVKPIADFHEHWQQLLSVSKNIAEGSAEQSKIQRWAVVGAGAGGVELALAMAFRLQNTPHCKISLVFDSETVLPGYPEKVQRVAELALRELGVELHPNFRVREVLEGDLLAETNENIKVDQSIWCTGGRGAGWLAGSGLDLDARGFIHVNEYLQSAAHENIFAVGDCAHMLSDPRPKAGVYAVRQAPFLYDNLQRLFAAKAAGEAPQLQPCKLQSDFLSLLSLGDKRAVASRNGFSVAGAWVWRWKDHIDQRFMRQFSNMPMREGMNQSAADAQDEPMHCRGCASKINPHTLSESLSALASHPAVSLEWEDALVWRPQPKKHHLQSVDGFRSFCSDSYQFARIAMEHAFNDIYAMGGEPVHTQLWANVEFLDPRLQQRDLEQLLIGAADVCLLANASLLGGHSSEGPEIHLGVHVDGVLHGARHWPKSPPAEGDYLLLTKPVGSGVIQAADAQAMAPAAVLDAALASMQQSNRAFAQALAHLQPSAVTDVSGFGLLGHLLEMLGNSELQASLFLDRVPLLPGALDLSAQGVQSSLTPGLESMLEHCEGAELKRPEVRLLLDPQTSGGLLCAIERQSAIWLLDHFPQTAHIGHIVKAQQSKKLNITLSKPAGDD